jgi:ribosome-binding protein aMBF1 (putative translation factor)
MKTELYRARTALGLSQAKLAELVGSTKSNINRLELGRMVGSVQIWDKLERVLGVPQQQLREATYDSTELKPYKPGELDLMVKGLELALKRLKEGNHE